MGDVKSKNLYELLGNSHDQDSDQEPEPPVKTVDKPLPRGGKRDAPKEAPGAGAAGAGANGRRPFNERTGGFGDDDRGFRQRTNNRGRGGFQENRNRDQPVDNTDGVVRGRDSGPGTQRGGRGRGGPRRGGDRHSRTGVADHQKQVAQGWGAETGDGENAIEEAGEADAQKDKKEELTENATVPDEPIPEPEPEPEDNSVSYAQYLEQQAAKKLEGLGIKEARAANEGAKENKKWKNATALDKEKVEDAYFVGEQKARREREKTAKKQVLDIDYAFKEQPRESSGRGGARGRGDRGRGRGEGRGEYRGRGRGDREGGEGRGAYRGDRPPRDDNYQPRGGERGGRGGRGRSDGAAPVAIADESAFPSLGGK